MARIFIDGFENGAFSSELGWSGYLGPPWVELKTDVIDGFKGIYSVKTGWGWYEDVYITKTLSSSKTEIYLAYKVYPLDVGGSSNSLLFKDSAGTVIAYLIRPSALRLVVGSTTIATGITTINANTTYLIEIHYKPLNSGGVFALKVNGIEQFTYTGDTTAGLENIKSISWNYGKGRMPGYYDDIIADDSNWIGNTYVQKGQVSGAGTTTQFTPSPSSSANYQCIDEIPASNTDYNSSNTTGHIDTFAVSNMTGVITSVKAVQLEMLFAYEGTPTPTHMQLGVRSGGTDYFDTDNTPALSFNRFSKILETNPDGDVAWTESTVNAMEIGYKATA